MPWWDAYLARAVQNCPILSTTNTPWPDSDACWAELKGDGPKVTEPNLRFTAKIFGFLRICGFLRFPAPSKCLNFQEKGWICENLRFSAENLRLGLFCHLSSVPLSATLVHANLNRRTCVVRLPAHGVTASLECEEEVEPETSCTSCLPRGNHDRTTLQPEILTKYCRKPCFINRQFRTPPPPPNDSLFIGCTRMGSYSAKGVFLPSKHLLSAFYNTPPPLSKNPSKSPCPYWNPYKVPSKNPSQKALPLKNLLRTLLRSVRLHDPLGVRPSLGVGPWYGGVQKSNVWGEENVPENALSRIFLDPSKRVSGLLCRGFLYRKNRALTPEGGGKRTVGPKPAQRIF